MGEVLDSNLEEINMLGQRSGRMLSLVDLIQQNTVPLPVAAYLIDGVQKGASALIGAIPNRAGKTTLMGALLGVLPASDRIVTIESARMIPLLPRGSRDRPLTYVIQEIARGSWFGSYLSGPPVVDVTRLVDPNTRLMSTLHADTVEGVKATFRRFGFEKAVNVFNFIIFIQHDPWNPPRVVDEIWAFDQLSQSHNQRYSHTQGFSPAFHNQPNSHAKSRIKWEKFLSHCQTQNIHYIEEVAYTLEEYKQKS